MKSLPQLATARHALWAAAAAAALSAGTAAAQGEACRPGDAERVSVRAVREDAALVLGDGRAVRLAGIVVPRDGAPRLREALAGLAGGEVLVEDAADEPDRHGRVEAAVFTADAEGALVAERLVASGLVRAYPEDLTPCGSLLLAAEAEARAAGRGLWADPAAAPLPASEPERILSRRGEFVLVEGPVLSVGQRPRRTYLNFGAFWNEDFTAYMDTDALAALLPAGLQAPELTGRRVRIRGYVLEDRGPAIAVTRPGQVELVDAR